MSGPTDVAASDVDAPGLSGDDRPTPPTVDWAVRTMSGSTYSVCRDARGQWWLAADNVPSRRSRPLADGGPWRINPPDPWPPLVGASMLLLAPVHLSHGDPARVPGGGKVTSPVVEVSLLTCQGVTPAGGDRGGASAERRSATHATPP